MWTKRLLFAALVGGLILFGLAAQQTAAAPGGPTFALDWYTMDAGGGTSTGATFSVSGTAGQADAGSHAGSTFHVEGGFWSAWLKLYGVELPVIFKN
jgi:hypothetical protein